MVFVLSGICYVIARGIRYYTKQQRRGLLDPPIDLLDEFKKKDDVECDLEAETTINNRTRYTKAQARQRFKRGKT